MASVAALDALALIASYLPSLNLPTPIYAILASDTFIPLTIPSSWREFSAKYDTQVTDYPQEQGAFQPYNKVKRPVEINVGLTKTGSDLARFAWLAAIMQTEANKPTQLYTIISPQLIGTDYTLTDWSYETRSDRGSNILYLSLRFTEVPQIPSSTGTYTSTSEAKSGPLAQLGQLFTNATSAASSALVNAEKFITS